MNLSGVQLGGIRPIELDSSCTLSGPTVFYQDELVVDEEEPIGELQLHMALGLFRGDPRIVAHCNTTDVRVSGATAEKYCQVVSLKFSPAISGGEMSTIELGYMIQPDAPITQHRRSSGEAGADRLTLTVSFPHQQTPQRYWRTEWSDDSAEATIVGEAPVTPRVTPTDIGISITSLDLDVSNIAPNRVLGFRWEW